MAIDWQQLRKHGLEGRPEGRAALEPGGNLRKSWEALLAEARVLHPLRAVQIARTQTVFGEGPLDAKILFVGEQPGDQEDLAGRPFVGPAGQLFDAALEEAGIDRAQTYVTNAVKHFKFVAARQEAHPYQARRRRDRRLPLVARAGARADPAAGDGRARRDRGALADRQGRDHQPRSAARR